MLRRIPVGLLAIVLVAMAFVARAPRTGPGTAEAAGPVASITLSVVNSPSVCGYNATVVATLKDAGGNVVDNGTLVAFTASSGASITPVAATNTGRALAALTTPYTMGAVTVTATSGAVSAQTGITAVCGIACNFVTGCLGTCNLYNACGTVCGIQVTSCAPACGTQVPSCSVCLGAPCYGYGIGYNNCGIGTACYACGNVLCGGVCGLALGCGAVYAPLVAPAIVVSVANPAPNVGAITFLPYPKSGSCGSTLSITILVTMPGGQAAPNGTAIGFTTNLGAVESQVTTLGGQAVARLTIDPKVSGNATITATAANGTKASETLPISC